MNSEDNKEIKSVAVGEIWRDGMATAGSNAALNLVRSGRPMGYEELLPVWVKTIDLIMEIVLESPEDLKVWEQNSPDEKYELFKGQEMGYESFVDNIRQGIEMMKSKGLVDEAKVRQAQEETARQVIIRAVSRASNQEVEGGIDLEPRKDLMSSEKIVEIGITREKLLDSLRQDAMVISADCVDGGILLNTMYGEISFRMVFGDEAGAGKA